MPRSEAHAPMGFVFALLLATASAHAQLPTPSLVSPANGATGVSTTPLLDWSAVSGATQYRVFLSTSSSTLSALSSTTTTCSGCLINTTTTSDSYSVPSGILANNTTYYWMVRAGNSTTGSPNSAIRSFTTTTGLLATPSLLSPANGATGVSTTPLLDWSAVSGATHYRIFLSTSSSTLSALSSTTTTCSGCLINTTTSSDSYTVPSGTLANNTTYYWMVRAGNATAGSPNSAIRSFTTTTGLLATPSLLSPANGATGVSTTPLLDWSAVSGATHYRIFLSTSSSTLSALSSTTTTCSGCLINTTTSSDSYTVPSGTLANNTTYYWMVRAGNATAGSLNSAIRSFTTTTGLLAAPSLLSPANGATGVSTMPLLDWSAVSGATHYRIFLSSSSSTLSALSSTTTTCSGCLINTTTSPDSYTVPSGILANNTIYYWMVRAGNATAGSPNSAIRSFTTMTGLLAAPSLLSPANGATGVSTTPLLDWSAVSGATHYRVFLSTSSSTLSALSSTTTTCSGCLINTTTTSDSYTVPSGTLANNTTYYWMVRAGNATAGSPNSAIRSFATMTGLLATPSLLSPANGAINQSTLLTLDWSDVATATKYRVFVHTSHAALDALSDIDTACTGCLINQITTGSSYPIPTSQELSSGTTYYWMVRAGNATAGSLNSPIRSFTTTAATLTVPSLLSPADGATGLSAQPTLSWSSVPGALRYRLFVHTSRSTLAGLSDQAKECSGCAINELVNAATSYAVPSTLRLSSGTTYFWMVRAGNDTSGSKNSAIRSFSTAPGSFNSPTNLNPGDGSTIQSPTSTLFTWSLNNSTSSLTGIRFTLRTASGYGGMLGAAVGDCSGKAIPAGTSYRSESCGGLSAGQWYQFAIELSFTDGSRRSASSFFRAGVSSAVRFQFQPLPTTQDVGVPFPVEILAVDDTGTLVPNFDQEVELSSEHASVSPQRVHLQGGFWSGLVKFDAPALSTQLRVRYGILYGQSQSFSVVSQSLLPGSIAGRVTGQTGMLQVPIHLSDAHGGPISSSTSDVNGHFSFVNLEPGTYEVTADSPLSGAPSTSSQVQVPAKGTVTVELKLVTAGRPVLLVPGIMGSTLKDRPKTQLTPFLPKEYPASASSLRLFDPDLPFREPEVGYEVLASELRSRGYTVFEVPWDWRVPAGLVNSQQVQFGPQRPEAWKLYLKPAIDRAKESTGYQKVDIVAHSMGGLMTRAYIQSDLFENDVDRFAMVGTPNHGSALAYFIVEGGDPHMADQLGLTPWLQFYESTTTNLFWVMRAPVISATPYFPTPRELRDFYYEDVPGAAQLLPTYTGAVQKYEPDTDTWSNIDFSSANPFLVELNLDPDRSRMGKSSDTTGKIKTKLFRSYTEETLENVRVTAQAGKEGTYPYGVPVPEGQQQLSILGDGTVRAWLPRPEEEIDFADQMLGSGAHAELIKSFAPNVADFLDAGRVAAQTPAQKLPAPATVPATELAVSLIGRAQPSLANAAGQSSGIDPGTGALVEEIPGSVVSLLAESASVSIVNGAAGLYTLDLAGPYTDNEDLLLTLHFFDGAETFDLSFAHLYHGGTLQLSFEVTGIAPEPLLLLHNVEPPTHLRIEERNGVATLAWLPSPDPRATGYNVYARSLSEPHYRLLGTTTGTSWPTGHPLVPAGEDTTWLYTVVSRNAAGVESIFVEVVDNRRPANQGVCAPARTLACGAADNWSNSGSGSTDAIDSYACLSRSYTGPESVYLFTPATDTHVQLSLGGLSADLDVIVMSDPGGGCTAGGCSSHRVQDGAASETVRFGALAGHSYYIAVDGRDGAVGNYSLQLTCDGATFADVPPTHRFFAEIMALYNAGITTGCSPSPRQFCPASFVNRGEMAVFLERGLRSRYFVPPAATGLFADLSAADWMTPWIEQFYRDGITRGCSPEPLQYCKDRPVTRAEMAVFLLRARYGSTYVPPPASGLFADVPLDWMAPWIEQLYREGITTGCGSNPLIFCPQANVTRSDMAAFLTRTFQLPRP